MTTFNKPHPSGRLPNAFFRVNYFDVDGFCLLNTYISGEDDQDDEVLDWLNLHRKYGELVQITQAEYDRLLTYC